jgi:hypothetical protein
LDADKLDGLDSTQFLRSDTNDDVLGALNFKADNQFKINLFNTSNHPSSEIHFNSYVNYGSDYGYIRYDDDNNTYAKWGDSKENSALVMGVSNDGQTTSSDVVAIESPAGIFLNAPEIFQGIGNKVWHSGNDGAGSGLDADKLDGLDSTQFLRSDVASNMNADLQMLTHKLRFNNGNYETRCVLQTDNNFVLYAPFHTLAFGAASGEPVKIDGSPILTDKGNSLNTNGYQKLSNGLIIQWGVGPDVSNPQEAVFPIAFNNIFSVVATRTEQGTDDNTTAGGLRIIDYSTTKFHVDTVVGGSNKSRFTWIAIGN